MEAFDMARKLAFAGRFSAVPFTASPVYITSQILAPELASVRVFVPPLHWTEEGIMDVAREIAATLGPTAQYDVGIAQETNSPDLPGASFSGEWARVSKLDPASSVILLRLGDSTWRAEWPLMDFRLVGSDQWRERVTDSEASVNMGLETL